MSEARIVRTSVAVLTLVLAGGLTACGGSTSSGPSASKADFCRAFDALGADTTPGHAADELSKVGTPSGIDPDERHGFELLVDHLRGLPDKRSPGGITKMVQDMNAQDAGDVRAFVTYYFDECQSSPSAPAS
jgi:hypothetical protein